MAGPALVARAAGRLCALPLLHVVETMRPLPVDPVADAGAFVLGVSMIRGVPTVVVDLDALLGDRDRRVPHGRFVLLKVDERRVALAVEAVLGVEQLEPAHVTALPPLLDEAGGPYAALATADARLLVVLRAARLLPPAEEAVPR